MNYLVSIGKEKAYNFAQFIDYRPQRQAMKPAYRPNRIPVIAYGIEYPSIREAAHINNITYLAAQKCLNDANNKN